MNQVRCRIGELLALPATDLDLHPMAHLVPDMQPAFYAEFKEDVRIHGIKTPVEVVQDGAKWLVLDGRHRLLAALDIPLADVPCRVVDLDGEDPVEFMYRAGTQRRDITATQRVIMGTEMSNYRSARDSAADRKGGRPLTPPKPPQLVAEVSVAQASIHDREVERAKKHIKDAARERESRAVLAKETGISHATVQKVITVLKEAETDAELAKMVPAMKSGTVSVDQAMRLVREKRKASLAVKLRSVPMPSPNGPFRVIVVDPPWQYDKRKADITHRGRNPYPDMTIEEICALPVGALAEPDCILWLWTTNAFMRDAYRCLDAWGFQEKTILTWVKNKLGTGDWLRGQTEHCILAVKGNPMVTLTNQSTVMHADRREHSRKPDEFYGLVEALCPGTKLEMFSRAERPSWASWGAETGTFAA